MLICQRPRSTEWCESELTLRDPVLPPDSAMHTATAVAQFPPPALFQAEAQVEMVGAAAAGDVDVDVDVGGDGGASSSSAVDIVRDALRLVRQRAAERKQMRRHYEETALHQQQQVMATPTRPQAQVAAMDGGQRQLEPPLEHVGGPNGGGGGGKSEKMGSNAGPEERTASRQNIRRKARGGIQAQRSGTSVRPCMLTGG